MIVVVTDLNEIPNCCGECSFFIAEFSDYGYCAITDASNDSEEQTSRCSDCPLKEVPDNALS